MLQTSTKALNPLLRLRLRLGARLGLVGSFFDRHPLAALLPLVVLYIPVVLSASRAKPLWHDELFTFYIAQAPSLREMWADLRIYDLNPPLVYLLTRCSFLLFGVSTLTTRLPEMIGCLLALIGLFSFVQRRIGAVFGMFAAALLLGSKSFLFAIEARPYSLLLGGLALAMVGWQQAKQDAPRTRRLGIALLAISLTATLLSHIFAVLATAALVGAEAWESLRTRKMDWPVMTVMLLPFAAIFSYIPMLRSHGGAIYPLAFQPDGNTIFEFYIGSIDRELVELCLTALAVLVCLGHTHLRAGPPNKEPAWFFPSREWVAIVGLLAAPLVLMIYLMATGGAFFSRYGATGGYGAVLLATALLCRWTCFRGIQDPRAALLGTLIVLLITGQPMLAWSEMKTWPRSTSMTFFEPRPDPCEACTRTSTPGPDHHPLPLVDASGLTFLEMNHNESSETLSRLYYLTDRTASTNLAHANIFERMQDEVQGFHLRGHAMPYVDFLQLHPRFYVLGDYNYPEDWLLRQLIADGANVRLLGRMSGTYRAHELYEVTLNRQSVAPN